MIFDDEPAAEHDTYAEYARPGVARALRAFGLDVAFASAQGDHLYRTDDPTGGRPVLDLVGGYGVSLFGHNHPRLVAALNRALKRNVPMNAQASVHPVAARLAERLAGLVGAATGRSYVVTLGSTGADAVESAMKHAVYERIRRIDELQERVERALRWVRREGIADQAVADLGAGQQSWEDSLNRSRETLIRMRSVAPSFVSLSGAFHGKTAGAAVLTENTDAGDGLRVPGPRRLLVEGLNPDEIITAADDELEFVVIADPDARGGLCVSEVAVSTVAACFVEPIQGEGGVREVPGDVLKGLRELVDRHGAVLVFDEIQTGMGRTGSFLASERSGVIADYYLLGKSLGGGLSKVSAMLVTRDRYVDDFGRYHTSTFADDDLSAVVGLEALDLVCDLMPSIPALADRLRGDLEQLAGRWPDVFAEVRGRGLLLGLELRPAAVDSALLREMLSPDHWGYVVAGYLLDRHAIRVLPTLSAPLTLRIEPSACLDEAACAHLVGALDDMASRVSRGDYVRLLAHLARPSVGGWRMASRPSRPPRNAPNPDPTGPTKVAFLANLEGPETIRLLAPELSSWTDERCSAALDRVLGELRPFEVTRRTISSRAADPLEVMVIGVPFSAAQASSLLHKGERPWLSKMVLEAVDLAVESGASVVGLGAYTSIVTGSARDVVEDGPRVTSGNSLAAACAWRHVENFASTRPGPITVGVVGALGNIGAVLATLLAATADSLVLVGRAGSGRRLRRLGDSLSESAAVSVSEDMDALRECDVVVSASNAPHPVVLPRHLGAGEPRLVYDLAVPGDIHPAVTGLPHVQWRAGGRMRLPLGQRTEFQGIGLAPGLVYACMAETMVLGFEPGAGIVSHGPLTADGVRAISDLAAKHGFEFTGGQKVGSLL